MLKTALVFLLLCVFPLSSAFSYKSRAGQKAIRIASFNIQVFGVSKAKKQDVMKIIAGIISKFDIVAIQEIRDKSGFAIKKLEALVDGLGIDYSYIIGPRLGRTSSKEQYAYIYKTGAIKAIGSYTYNDRKRDLFHREPFIGYFKTKQGNFDFVLINIHTDPDEAKEEIGALPEAVKNARRRFRETDIIILGDFNADCRYFKEDTYRSIFPENKYNWIIVNNEDTTVKGTVCTYDRIVATVSTDEDYTGLCGVYRFDKIYKLTQKKAARVSDHYPVWGAFLINKDSN